MIVLCVWRAIIVSPGYHYSISYPINPLLNRSILFSADLTHVCIPKSASLATSLLPFPGGLNKSIFSARMSRWITCNREASIHRYANMTTVYSQHPMYTLWYLSHSKQGQSHLGFILVELKQTGRYLPRPLQRLRVRVQARSWIFHLGLQQIL